MPNSVRSFTMLISRRLRLLFLPAFAAALSPAQAQVSAPPPPPAELAPAYPGATPLPSEPAPPAIPVQEPEDVGQFTPSVEPGVPRAIPESPSIEPGVTRPMIPAESDFPGTPSIEPGVPRATQAPAMPAPRPVPVPGDSDERGPMPVPAPVPSPAPGPVTRGGGVRQKPSIDDIGRFIAGANFFPESAYQAFEGTAFLTGHREACREMATQWEQIRLQRMRGWAAQEIAPLAAQADALLYMFGGPDLIYPNTLFPNMSEYVLAGLEPIGSIPEFFSFNEAGLDTYLQHLRHTLRSIMKRSFFETREMREDFGKQGVDGVFPVLLYFAILGGNEILTAEYITLTENGDVAVAKNSSSAKGVRLRFRSLAREGAKTQTAYYFKTDLSNSGLNSYPRFLKFLNKRGASAGYLKAASYLMHQQSFTKIRDYLLGKCGFILQDESGVPFRYLKNWQTQLYGHYAGPVEMFKEYLQMDLADAFQKQGAKPLPFGTGYRNHDSESVQILSIRR